MLTSVSPRPGPRLPRAVSFAAVLLAAAFSEPAGAGQLYWTQPYRILASNLDGSATKVLINEETSVRGIAVDELHGKLYWTDAQLPFGPLGRVRRSDLDGSSVEDVIVELDGLNGIAVDPGGGKLYWTEMGTSWRIRRANLDGSGIEDLLGPPDTSFPRTVALDTGAGKLYWIDAYRIRRANLDGSAAEDVVTGIQPNEGLEVDPLGGKLYWADGFAGAAPKRILRANLDGSNVETVVQGDPFVVLAAVGLDLVAGKVYWTTTTSAERVERANLDGSDREIVLEESLTNASFESIDVVPALGKFYWARIGLTGREISRADLDGSNAEDVVVQQSVAFTDVAFGPGQDAIYFTSRYLGRLERASASGTGRETVLAGLDEPAGLAIDVVARKVYWTEQPAGKIRRADLDGTDVEDVVTAGLAEPHGIDIDAGAGWVYWTERAGGLVRRSRLDGSAIETLAGGQGLPAGIALDLDERKVYWVNLGTGQVRRADLDGSNAETFSTLATNGGGGIAIDVGGANGRVYWNDSSRGYSANRDGTDLRNDGEHEGARAIAVRGRPCGDGVIDPGEECDDGNNASGDACERDCLLPQVCGDGIHAPGEECDDGNTIDDDGCMGDCTLPSDALYGQLDGAGGGAVADQLFDVIFSSYNCEAADDFVVTSPAGWFVSRVFTDGTSSVTPAFVNVAFYPDSGGLPAEEPECEYVGLTSFTNDAGDLMIALPASCLLGEGHWWIAQQVRQDWPNIHFWRTRGEQALNEAAWRNPGQGLTTVCYDWAPLTACDVGGGDRDLLFALSGQDVAEDAVPVPAVGPLGASLIVLLLGCAAGRILRTTSR